jgi:hypothetical protein
LVACTIIHHTVDSFSPGLHIQQPVCLNRELQRQTCFGVFEIDRGDLGDAFENGKKPTWLRHVLLERPNRGSQNRLESLALENRYALDHQALIGGEQLNRAREAHSVSVPFCSSMLVSRTASGSL